jgi:hypothetical protein
VEYLQIFYSYRFLILNYLKIFFFDFNGIFEFKILKAVKIIVKIVFLLTKFTHRGFSLSIPERTLLVSTVVSPPPSLSCKIKIIIK